jgi:hypothetical protein
MLFRPPSTLSRHPLLHDYLSSLPCNDKLKYSPKEPCPRLFYMEALNKFSYYPLQGNDIRCIKVRPLENVEGRVECTLVQAPIEELHYTSLSYSWGAQQIHETVYLDGTPIEVTTNLAAFLRQMAKDLLEDSKSATSSAHFWIDALCIDQANMSERNAQVKRMGDIYSAADGVLVWLGPAGEHSDAGVERIRTIAHNFDKLGKVLQVYVSLEKSVAAMRLYEEIIQEEDPTARKGLAEVYTRPWWQRIWILQEAALAKTLHFLCGSATFSFEELYRSVVPIFLMSVEDAELLYRPWVTETAVVKCLGVTNLRTDYIDDYGDKDDHTMLQRLLSTYSSAQATDPRDKVYGILGIQSDFKPGEIQPDYRSPPERLYMSVVKAHLFKYDTLSILAQSSRYVSDDQETRLTTPSWVPDWSTTERREEPLLPWRSYSINKKKFIPYHASNDMPLSSHPWSLNEDAGELKLCGAILDSIKTLAAEKLASTSPDDLRRTARLSLDLCKDLPPIYELTGEETSMAFRRAMAADFSPPSTVKKGRGFAVVLQDDPPMTLPDAVTSIPLPAFTDWRIAVTERGWVCLVPWCAQIGDKVAVLIGGPTPYLLRSRQIEGGNEDQQGGYTLVGETYVHGLMDGKAMGLGELREIVLH